VTKEIYKTAIHAALQAGAAILEIYGRADFGIELKEDETPLTLADRKAHDIIAGRLASSGIPVLSEEDAKNHSYEERKNWKQCWIVDPLDGTKEFIKRNGEFTVNIALVENGKPLLGIIYVPVKDLLYYTHPNEGCFRIIDASRIVNEGIAFEQVRQLLPAQERPSIFTLVGSRSHASSETDAYVKELEHKYGQVRFIAAGSSLKFCLVAEGQAHAYPRFAPTMEWDTAAGQAILEAAGGTVVMWPEKMPLSYNRENLRNGWFLASSLNE
jgi:3'(2'), 5'-bisphosphate nucleotidase